VALRRPINEQEKRGTLGLEKVEGNCSTQGVRTAVGAAFSALAFLLSVQSLFAQGWNIEATGHIGGDCYAICAQGDYIYAGDGPSLKVFDAHDISAPVPLSYIVMPNFVRDIALSGNLAYVAAGDLIILDTSDPASPTLKASYRLGEAEGVFVSGTTVYVANGSGGELDILDVSDPTSPTFLGEFRVGFLHHAHSVAVSGGTAYIADHNKGVAIVDVQNPQSPAFITEYRTPDVARDIVVVGNLAYVADGEDGLLILDVSDPSSPTLRGSHDTFTEARSVVVSGGVAYLTSRGGRFELIDVTNPDAPALLGFCYLEGNNWMVHLQDDKAYVACEMKGFQVVNVADPAHPSVVGSYSARCRSWNFSLSGPYAYLAGGSLTIVDVSDPKRPRFVSEHDLGYPEVVWVKNHLAYTTISSHHGLLIADVSDPSSPTTLAFYPLPTWYGGDDIWVSGDLAYISAAGLGLVIFDVSDPSSPVLVSIYPVSMALGTIEVRGDLAYFVAAGALRILDVSDPSSPTQISEYDLNWPEAATISGDRAYVAGSKLWILDVSDPSSPTLLDSWKPPPDVCELCAVAVEGGRAYLTTDCCDSGEFLVVDVSGVHRPRCLASYWMPDSATDLVFAGGLAYVAGEASGFWIFRFAPPPPPEAPSNLTVTGVSSSRIELAWDDNSTNEDGFIIERKAGSSDLWSEIAWVGAGETSYVDTGLWPGTTYVYRVRAYNSGGDSPCSNNASARTRGTGKAVLTGQVVDRSSGEPLAGVDVEVGVRSATTDARGKFVIVGIEPGEAAVNVHKTGYYVARRDVTFAEGATVVENFALDKLQPGAGPIVWSVTSKYTGPGRTAFFLDGVDVNVRFTAHVDWNGTPGVVRFITPSRTFEQTDLSRSFNMGSDFGPGGHLQVVAVNGEGKQSEPYTVEFEIMPGPPCTGTAGGTVRATEREFKYSLTVGAELIEIGVGDGVISGSIPLVGGKAFGIAKSVQVKLEISSLGVASIDFESDLPTPGDGIKIGGTEISPSFKVHVEWRYSPEDSQWHLSQGTLGVSAETKVNLPPTPPYCVYLLTLGPIPIYLRGEVSVELGVTLEINGWTADGPDLNGVLAFSPGLTGYLGAGVAEAVSVEGYLGGTLNLEGQWPHEPMLRKCSILFTGGVRAEALGMEYSIDLLSYEWDLYGEEGLAGRPMRLLSAEIPQSLKGLDFHPLPRDYLEEQPYARFEGNAPSRASRPSGAESAIVEQAIEQNVFPYSQPAVATADGKTLLVWIHDDPARSAVNRTELVYSLFDGSSWTTPAAVADDGTADFAPTVAPLPDGTFLVAWNDAATTFADSATLDDLAAAMEVAVSRYDPAAGTWTPPLRLTDNGVLDHTPHLASAGDGTALLTWIRNTANDIIGSATAPNAVCWSRWNGTAWSTEATAAGGLGSVIKTSLAYKGDSGALVFSADLDDYLTSETDQELFALSWNGTGWSGPVRLTTDTVRDAAPQAIYDSSGDLLVAWLRGDEIAAAHGLSLADRRTAVVSGRTEGAGDFRLARDPATTGPIVIFWADASPEGNDIWSVTYDTAHDSWGEASRLTADDWMERSLAPTFLGPGRWLVAYNKVETLYTTQTVTIGSRTVEVPGVPSAGRTDLCVIRHTVGGDLAVFSSDITVTPPNPSPGSDAAITATVRNLGDLAAENVEVAFYDGDPAAGGLRIGTTQVIPGPLAAGRATTAGLSWSVPSDGLSHRIFVVVDPDGKQDDRDRSNNRASLETVKPDLAVRELVAESLSRNRHSFVVRVENRGAIEAPAAKVRLFVEGGIDVTPREDWTIPLLPGEYCDLAFTCEKFLGYGSLRIRAVVDEENLVSESDETNNERISQIYIKSPTAARSWEDYR